MGKKNPKEVIQKEPAQKISEIEEHRRAFLKRMAAVGVGVGLMGLEVRPLFAQQRREMAGPGGSQPITIQEFQQRYNKLTPKQRESLKSIKVYPPDSQRSECDEQCKKCAAWKVFSPPVRTD